MKTQRVQAFMSFPIASFKASPSGAGEFTALVSVFDVMDAEGDVMQHGAFLKSLNEFGEDPIPILWHHNWTDPLLVLGGGHGQETDEGLLIDGKLAVDTPAGARAFELLVSRTIKEFSVGGWKYLEYDVVDGVPMWKIPEYDLAEVSLAFRGSNPKTELLGVKGRQAIAAQAAAEPAEPVEPAEPSPAADDDASTGDAHPPAQPDGEPEPAAEPLDPATKRAAAAALALTATQGQ